MYYVGSRLEPASSRPTSDFIGGNSPARTRSGRSSGLPPPSTALGPTDERTPLIRRAPLPDTATGDMTAVSICVLLIARAHGGA